MLNSSAEGQLWYTPWEGKEWNTRFRLISGSNCSVMQENHSLCSMALSFLSFKQLKEQNGEMTTQKICIMSIPKCKTWFVGKCGFLEVWQGEIWCNRLQQAVGILQHRQLRLPIHDQMTTLFPCGVLVTAHRRICSRFLHVIENLTTEYKARISQSHIFQYGPVLHHIWVRIRISTLDSILITG